MTGRRGRRRKKLLDDLEERRECWKLKEEALEAMDLSYKRDCGVNEWDVSTVRCACHCYALIN